MKHHLSNMLLVLTGFLAAVTCTAIPLSGTQRANTTNHISPRTNDVTIYDFVYTIAGESKYKTYICEVYPEPNVCIATMVDVFTQYSHSDYVQMWMFDNKCNQIGNNGNTVTRDDLAAPGGWGFSSELEDFLVVHIPRDWPNSGQATFDYNSQTTLQPDPDNRYNSQISVGPPSQEETDGFIYTLVGQFDCTSPTRR
ncbi:uncharacterized protein LY89DRAFT_736583 [Mollisia scopiformis]|uniref:Secreted protein n=1 Tax=Mollisia scopiformis TaxID=149040 RepID=A0A194X406_MOLSC|nr:uncharacterized protein LY89DRAFT_736583 [Mollisia scopiformis]KUJ14552.1 hypothetical protein LY89DRAFT_736583 [Mollisia scopiformis]